MSFNFIEIAKSYVEKGLSIVGCKDKRPLGRWSKHQERLPDSDEIERFKQRGASQIAIICGAVSGKANKDGELSALEVLDIDSKYHLDPDQLYKDLINGIIDLFGEQAKLLPLIKTPSGGYHIYYRCPFIEGNQKLASRPAKEEELKEKPNVKSYCFFETRGEGGYVIAPPSKFYTHVDGWGTVLSIPFLSIDERDSLLSFLRSFNEVEERVSYSEPSKKGVGSQVGETPWEAYDQVDEWKTLLLNNGWSQVSEDGTKIFFKRPGSENKQSANWHKGKRLFYVFSSNTSFEPGKAYAPSAIHAILEHNGDFKEAAKKLRSAGYGATLKKPQIKTSKEKGIVTIDDHLERCTQFIERNKLIYLDDPDNESKFIAAVLATNFEEKGRSFFHRISTNLKNYRKQTYNETYDAALKSKRGLMPMGLLYYKCGYIEYKAKAKSMFQVIDCIVKMDLKHNLLTGKLEQKGGDELSERREYNLCRLEHEWSYNK